MYIIPGLPPRPTNLAAIPNGLGSLNISWSLATFVKGVPVNFALTAMNLNDSTAQTISSQEQHHIFSVQDSTSCDTYSFQVTAMAGSGDSDPSEVITRSIPSLPDISLVVNSVDHSLAKTANSQFTLNIRIQVVCLSNNHTVSSISNPVGCDCLS